MFWCFEVILMVLPVRVAKHAIAYARQIIGDKFMPHSGKLAIPLETDFSSRWFSRIGSVKGSVGRYIRSLCSVLLWRSWHVYFSCLCCVVFNPSILFIYNVIWNVLTLQVIFILHWRITWWERLGSACWSHPLLVPFMAESAFSCKSCQVRTFTFTFSVNIK